MPTTTTRELVISAAALGIPSQPADKIIVAASAELRIALDNGLPRTHPRCEALLLLINSAQRHLIPKKNRLAPRVDGIARNSEEIAQTLDASAASTAAAIGLKHSEVLRHKASLILKGSARRHAPSSPSKTNNYSIPVRKQRPGPMKVRLLPRAAQSSADSLFELARTDIVLGRASILHKKNAVKLTEERRRRRTVRTRKSLTSNGAVQMNSDYNALQQARYQPRAPNHVPPRMSQMPMPKDLQSGQLPHRGNVPTAQPYPYPMTAFHQPEPHPSLPVATGNSNASMAIRQILNLPPTTPTAKPNEKDPEAFKAFSIRSVLADRERKILSRLSERRAELLSLPLGLSEDVRRKAIIESKQMKLLETQRRVRSKLCIEMKKAWSPSYQDHGVVPTDNLSRQYRRIVPVHTYTNGYPRYSPYDEGGFQMPHRTEKTVAQDSRNLAAFDRKRFLDQKRRKMAITNHLRIAHVQMFENYYSHAHVARHRINKAIERYFVDKARAEERRKKQEQYERLRLLRSNDEQAYFNLLKTTKNERLLQLVRQTDNYLMQIGAQVERVRDKKDPDSGAGATVFNDLKEGDKDSQSIDAMRARRDMYYTVTHSVSEEVTQPTIMTFGKLKPYQIEGLKWLVSLYNNGLNGILADEMGLGKTIQTIALLTYLIESKRNPGPYLVIVPLSTVGNWVRELDRWAPSVTKVIYRGNRDARRDAQAQLYRGGFNVVITTYEFVVRDQPVLSRFHWKYIIIDEGHRMKNAKCKLAITLGTKYRSQNRLLLTGTPLQNNLTELWALLNFLLPSIFSSSDTFEQWFQKPFESTTLGDTAELEEEETLLVINRLHQVLRPFLLRRLKTDVETQLPEKTETVIRCDMSAWQRLLYRQVTDKVGLATSATGSVKAFNNLLMQCKKICNHPYLFYDDEAILGLPDNMLIRTSGKFHLLQHLIPKLKASGHRTLIFSQMTSALDYLEDFLTEISVQFLRLDGGTKSDLRQDMLNEFNAPNSPYFCFLLSTRAGGLGLNLQTADTVIIFDSDWNPMMDLQAQDRAHRIGQKNAVRVFRLISSGTVEVKILEQANKKLQIDAQVIQAGQFNNKSTESDQHQMLKGLLSKKKNDGDELGDVPTLEELNRIVARNDEEFELFTKMDRTREQERPYNPLMEDEVDIPEWVRQPDLDFKTAEEKEADILLTHGRGRRKRAKIRDFDQLTEREWMDVMQGHVAADEVFEKRQRKRRKVRKAIDFEESNTDEDEMSIHDDEDEEDDEVEDGQESVEEREVEEDAEKRNSKVGRRSTRRKANGIRSKVA